MRTRLESKEQTRRDLLRAAHESFARDGYRATTLDRVAERAGFTKGAVYSAFSSKGDLFLAVYEERVAARTEETRTVAAAIDTMEGFAQEASTMWARVLRSERGWTAALTEFWVAAARDEALRERFLVAHRSWRDEVTAQIERISGRSTEEAGDMAMAMIALGNGLALEGLLGEDASGVLLTAMRRVLT